MLMCGSLYKISSNDIPQTAAGRQWLLEMMRAQAGRVGFNPLQLTLINTCNLTLAVRLVHSLKHDLLPCLLAAPYWVHLCKLVTKV